MEAFLRRGARSGLYPSQQTADEITDSGDDTLFHCVLHNNDHVFHKLLSKHVVMTEQSRRKKGHLAEKNFITRMPYKNAY